MKAAIHAADGRIIQLLQASERSIIRTANEMGKSWIEVPSDTPDDADSRFRVVDGQLVEIA